jgi:hypothetical protein
MATYTFTLPKPRAWTLDAKEVKEHVPEGDWINFPRVFERTHKDGWTIRGEIHNDWYSWVEDFVATHPENGAITREGNEVTAPSKQVWDTFVKRHPLTPFDYGDI